MSAYSDSISASYAMDDDRQSRLSARRVNKHVAERKRRARINTSLDQLKALIIGTMKKDPEEFDKMEKADILDLTVKFLQASQRCAKPTTTTPAATQLPRSAPNVQNHYQTGFTEGLKQTQRFARSSDMDQDMAARLSAHLARQMARNVSSGVAMTSQSRASLKAVKRCEPSARLCRNLNQEFTRPTATPKSHKTSTGLQSLSEGLRSLQMTGNHSYPAVNHRVRPAFHAVNVWRPWEGQVSA